MSKRARARQRRRERESRKQQRNSGSADQAQPIDHEALIHKLEAEVAKIERQLAQASERQDLEAIAPARKATCARAEVDGGCVGGGGGRSRGSAGHVGLLGRSAHLCWYIG